MKTQFKTWAFNYFLHPFSWSRWTDIRTFEYDGTYLLQGKVNKRSNAKKFRITNLNQWKYLNVVKNVPLSDLSNHGLIETQVSWN